MTEIFHQISFGMLIAAAVMAVVVGVERTIFGLANMRRSKMVLREIDKNITNFDKILGNDVASSMVSEITELSKTTKDQSKKDNIADAAYIHARDKLYDRLWLLDTVVTAAPLLGLLGTIFGIVDTFLALSKSGMSDPAGVSAGIGTALYATALGISVALVGLVIFNFLTNLNERICEYLKMIILRTNV